MQPIQEQSTEVNSWLQRTRKKGPFYLYSTEESSLAHRPGLVRRVIWKEKGKTKIGILQDGMWCRYGIKTYGVLKKDSPSGLWQASAGQITESEFIAMVAVSRDQHDFREFDLAELRNLHS